MPCKTVTIAGPQANPSASFNSYNISTGVNSATVTYEITNDGNVPINISVDITVNGSTVKTDKYSSVGVGSSERNSNSLTINVQAGSTESATICAKSRITRA